MILSKKAILSDLSTLASRTGNINTFLEEANLYLDELNLSEDAYEKVTEHLKLDLLDIDRFVSVNNCQPITDPRAFSRDSIPSDNGILSNKIFGYTQEERSGIFAYIDLHGTFLDPSCFKAWFRIDGKIRNIVHGIGTYIVDGKGDIIEDPKGKTGIKFLIDNINKIKFKSSESLKRDIRVQYLEKNRNNIFITKYLVIPPFYRDKNTSGSKRVVGLSGINKIYTDLIVATNALETTQDYMFDASNSMSGRVQEIILNIYDWFCGNSNANINDKDVGTGLSGKFGILQRAAMTKTANYSSRLVITAPELKVERPEDMQTNFDQCTLPLASAITEFKDFVLFHVRKYFEGMFVGVEQIPVLDNGKVKYYTPKDPEILFSDERIHIEMENFLHGYNNRFKPVAINVEESNKEYYLQFVGRKWNLRDEEESSMIDKYDIYSRRLTWCDIFYQAAVEATTNKHVLVTRFPIDSYTNQYVAGVNVASTKETQPTILETKYGNKFYRYYPKITEEDIGIDTSNKFVDTFNMSNLYLEGIGGD